MTQINAVVQQGRLSLVRAAATGAATFGFVFVACWLGTLAPGLSPTHAFIALFTAQPVGSTAALLGGVGWAVLFGALTATVLVFFHNLFGSLGRRAG